MAEGERKELESEGARGSGAAGESQSSRASSASSESGGSGGSGSRAVRGVGALRGRSGVAASILGVLLIGGYFAASRGDQGVLPPGYLISAAVLLVAFWFPAIRIGSVGELARRWFPVVVWLLAWTLVWDLAVTGLIGDRELFEEWWIVYPAGVAVPGALLALHGVVVARVEGRGAPGRPRD